MSERIVRVRATIGEITGRAGVRGIPNSCGAAMRHYVASALHVRFARQAMAIATDARPIKMV